MRRMERVPGDDVGGYRVIRTLGRGGSGSVYLVADGGGAQSALKLIDTPDEPGRMRLAREVAALQTLRHSAVPRLIDAELEDDEPFVVFEFIDGPSLSAKVGGAGPLPPAQVASLAGSLASALAAVHAAGVVHRDVTPANVLMGPAGPALIDFGLAHHHDDDRLTRTGLVSGTAGYVAPEVIDGAEPSAASDDWGLAATLAFAATGHAPFGTGMGAISATLVGEVRPDVPLTLARALTAAPQFRPTPHELARSLADDDQTAVFGVDELEPTRVAADWELGEHREGDGEGADERDDDRDYDEAWGDELEPGERVLPRRRLVLASWGFALIALATVAPLISALLALAGAVLARGADSAVRAVWRSRDRRGVDEGGVTAQAFASPWHLLRALTLTLPSALLAGGSAFLVGWLGYLLARNAANVAFWEALSLVLSGAVALVLLAWGPRGREARRGAHLIAAKLAPSQAASAAWVAGAAVVVVVCAGIGFAGIEPVWWPLG